MRSLTPGLFLDEEFVYDCTHKIDYMSYITSSSDDNLIIVNESSQNVNFNSDLDASTKKDLIFYIDTSNSNDIGIWKKY